MTLAAVSRMLSTDLTLSIGPERGRRPEGREREEIKKIEGREKKEIRQTEGKRRKGCG